MKHAPTDYALYCRGIDDLTTCKTTPWGPTSGRHASAGMALLSSVAFHEILWKCMEKHVFRSFSLWRNLTLIFEVSHAFNLILIWNPAKVQGNTREYPHEAERVQWDHSRSLLWTPSITHHHSKVLENALNQRNALTCYENAWKTVRLRSRIRKTIGAHWANKPCSKAQTSMNLTHTHKPRTESKSKIQLHTRLEGPIWGSIQNSNWMSITALFTMDKLSMDSWLRSRQLHLCTEIAIISTANLHVVA
jgi:hypothetical protein